MGVPLKQGCQNSNFLPLMQDAWNFQDMQMWRKDKVWQKLGGTKMKGIPSNQDAKIQNWTTHPGADEIFRIGKYEKINLTKLWSTTAGVPLKWGRQNSHFFTCVS